MIKKFLRRLGRAQPRLSVIEQQLPPLEFSAVPSELRVYAIGDVHGQIRQLRKAVDWMSARAEADACQGLHTIGILLGDYIDRGEDSRAVLDLLSKLAGDIKAVEWVFLAGNHEASMLAFLDNPESHAAWLRFGGVETLASYGVRPPMESSGRGLRRCRDDLARALPARHLEFLHGLRHSFQCGDYVFAHAGLRPGTALDRQTPEDLLWIREDFLDHPAWHGKCVVHGHTIAAEPALLAWRIGIDTGAYAGGKLSCLALSGIHREVVGFL